MKCIQLRHLYFVAIAATLEMQGCAPVDDQRTRLRLAAIEQRNLLPPIPPMSKSSGSPSAVAPSPLSSISPENIVPVQVASPEYGLSLLPLYDRTMLCERRAEVQPQGSGSFRDACAAFLDGNYDLAYSIAQGLAGPESPEATLLMVLLIEESRVKGPTIVDARRLLQQAASSRDPRIQFRLGYYAKVGSGVVPRSPDRRVAARWFGLAADQGYAAAQFQLSQILVGSPEQADIESAAALLKKSAQAGYQPAIEQLKKDRRESAPDNAAPPKETPKQPQARVPKSAKHKGTGPSFGTGFGVAPGRLLTNYHVVEGTTSCTVLGHEIVGRVVAVNPQVDLAVIAAEGLNVTAPWRRAPYPKIRVGEDVVVLGYPLPGLLTDELIVTTGTINALSGISNDARLMQIQAPVQPGNSGGPVLDRHGNVVGVVQSKLNALAVAKRTGDLPQNVNFSVSAPTAIQFLLDNNISPHVEPDRPERAVDEVAAAASRYTFRLRCP